MEVHVLRETDQGILPVGDAVAVLQELFVDQLLLGRKRRVVETEADYDLPEYGSLQVGFCVDNGLPRNPASRPRLRLEKVNQVQTGLQFAARRCGANKVSHRQR